MCTCSFYSIKHVQETTIASKRLHTPRLKFTQSMLPYQSGPVLSQSFYFVVFKPFCYNFAGMLRITVLLEGPAANQVLTFWLMSWGFSWVFLDNPPASWCNSVPFPAKLPHDTMLPPPRFTVGMVFFGLKSSDFFHHTHHRSLWPNKQLHFYNTWPENTPPKACNRFFVLVLE